ncbi:glycoside hydrolase family 113 [Tenacibaculum sp. C7A-26P2]|uniref:glycoside hydrolase family 113 n=1 Tax=Tenacibaculum sp. C7A-26P2 TaxID=3447504 RepID=UPI003F87F2CE
MKIKIKWLFIFGIICLHTSCESQRKKVNGVSFVASSDQINFKHTLPVKEVLANFVALMPYAFIENISSPEVQFNASKQWFGETSEGVEQYAEKFHREQVQIMIKPQIWVWQGEYTGLINMKTESDWKKLEKNYTKFILTFAKVAQKVKAHLFCVGTELERFVVKRPEYWNDLIKEVRKVYTGKITYAANWDEYHKIDLWNVLDYIGVDAYFPLSDEESPSKEDFKKGWNKYKKEIIAVKDKFEKPVLFTEYGYRSVSYTGKEPWNSNTIEGNVDLESQKKALEVLYEEFWDESWFAGGFLWKWFHNHGQVGGNNNNRFTPQNKPALEVIKKAYGKIE